MTFDAEMEGRYPNLCAVLNGRCGPVSQWPGVPLELRALLADWKQRGEENERLRADQNGLVALARALARLDAALALHTEGDNELCRECASPWVDGFCTSPTVKALRGGSDAD